MMKSFFERVLSACLFLLVMGNLSAQQDPRDLSGQAQVTAANEVSHLDRGTGDIISKVDLTITNAGPSSIRGPLHAVIEFEGQGDLDRIAVRGALGGRGQAPYQAHYLDLSAALGQGLATQAGLPFQLEFSRPPTLQVLYKVTVFGVANRPPLAALAEVATATVGQPVDFDASSSGDPDGDALSGAWDFGDDNTGSGLLVNHTYASPGVYDIAITVRDPDGLEDTLSRSLLVLPEGAFALARTRVLDDSGVPLAGVTVEEFRDGGPAVSYLADHDGYAVLGGEPGSFRWRFSKPGHVPVWREAELEDGRVSLVPSPWLAAVAPAATQVSPLEEVSVSSAALDLLAAFPAGAFSQPGQAGLTALNAQALPLPLPAGWSPLAALSLEGPGEILAPGILALSQSPPVSATVCLLRHDPDQPAWVVESVGLGFALPGYGIFAVVAADAPPTEPPAPVTREALTGFAAADFPPVTATGETTPPSRTASLDPALVTTTGKVTFTAESPLPSGRFFRTRVDERYSLRGGGGTLRPPEYDTTFFAYQRPGAPDPATLHAVFPLRPTRLFSPAELDAAGITVDVLEPSEFLAAVLGSEGGALSAGKIRLTLPPGRLSAGTAVELRQLDPAGFANALHGLSPFLAFQLGYSPREAAELLAALTGLPPESDFVLGRVIATADGEGLQPVLRMRSGADGIARSVEPDTPPRLPGITSGGTFVLVGVDGPQGLVRGTVTALDGLARAGLQARVDASPWRAVTATGGSFSLLAAPGAGSASAIDPGDGNRGTAAFSMDDPAAGAEVEIELVATGPSVVSISPADGATKVRPVEPVVVRFSEPLAPGSFGPAALLVTKDGDPTPVAGSLGLSDLDRTATFLPAHPLEAATTYTIALDGNIRDAGGNPIEGSLLFSFTTAAPSARGEGAQLVIYEPNAQNVPEEILSRLVGYDPASGQSKVVAAGSPGTADPEVAVILMNLSTGETATVLSRVDGSFESYVNAHEEDFVSAVFINRNGTRVETPASRQLFDDGRVGLYAAGGILEAESDGGPVRVFLEPQSIEERVKFRLDPVDMTKLVGALEGSLPADAQLLGGVSVAHEADQDVSEAGKVSFPIDRATLQLPPGVENPEEMSFVLTRVMENDDGTIVYEILDRMELEGDQLVTKSPPWTGLLFRKAIGHLQRQTNSFQRLKTSNNLLAQLGLPGIQETVIHQLLLPYMMITAGTTTEIIGNVRVANVDENGTVVGEKRPVIGAVVGISRPPFLPAGKFRPGAFVTVSREPNGFFVHQLDVTLEGTGFEVSATHPRFPGHRASSTGLVGNLNQRFLQGDISRVELLFSLAPPSDADLEDDKTPPQVRSAHTPVSPTAGMEEPHGATLHVVAIDDRAIAPMTVTKHSVSAFGGAALDLTTDVELIPLEEGAENQTVTRLENRFTVRSRRAARVTIAIAAADLAGNPLVHLHHIDFGRPPFVTPPETGEQSPRVTFAWPPPNAANLSAFPEIQLRFSKPMHPDSFLPENLDWLQFASGHFVTSLRPSPDRREVAVSFMGPASGPVSLAVGGPTLAAEDETLFDQYPGEDLNQTFNLSFALAEASSGTLDIERGGGVVGEGVLLFAIDRAGPLAGELVAYDISTPSNPQRIGSLSLPNYPSDLVYLPNYSLRRNLTAPCEERDLVVVVGGSGGAAAFGEASFGFKWLWVVDVTDPHQPVRYAGGLLSQDPTSMVVKLAKAMPVLAYQENAGDSSAVQLIDLPAFIIGVNSTATHRSSFPDEHRPGIDLNGDGDFCDPGELPSLPSRSPATYYGNFFSFAPASPRERIVDFDTSAGGLISAITHHYDTGVTTFRNLFSTVGSLDDDLGTLALPPGGEGNRVFMLDGMLIEIGGVPQLLDLAIVSRRPESAGAGAKLAIINVSDPDHPVLLGDMQLDPTDGTPSSLQLREDGLLVLSTPRDLLVLDPARLLEVDPQGRSLAIIGRISGMGSGVRSYVASASGLNALNAGVRGTVSFNGPSFSFVTLPGAPGDLLPASVLATQSAAEKSALLSQATVSPLLRRATIRYGQQVIGEGEAAEESPIPSPPLPGDHYYIVCRMPGSAVNVSASLPLLLASVNGAGVIASATDGDILPELLVDDVTRALLLPPPSPNNAGGAAAPAPPPAYPARLDAFRMSDDRSDPLYNVFLAGPFTLHGSLTVPQANALSEQLPRNFLRAAQYVMVALAPSGGTEILDPFRSQVVANNSRVLPGAYRLAPVESHRNPLIFVPGVMASTLNDDSFFDLWVPIFNGFVERIPYFSPLQPLISEAPGGGSVFPTDVLRYLISQPPALGSVDIQDGFLNYLHKELGYREYKWDYKTANVKALMLEAKGGAPNWDSLAEMPDLFPFPYDWRADNAATAERLALYVEMILSNYPDNEKVDIVAHSMGGLVTRRFMLDHPDKVENFVSIASPFLGATKSILSLKTGDLGEFALNLLIPSDTSVRIGRNMPALHQLMPNEGLIEDLGYRPLRENGWNLDGKGSAFDRLSFEQFAEVMDGPLFRDYRPDFAPALPEPMKSNRTFNERKQFDWRDDISGARHFHIVAVQQLPSTISWLEATPALEATDPMPDLGLSFPPARFPRTNRVRETRPLDGTSGQVDLEPGSFRLGYTLQPRRSAGDGTVPLLSQTRGYGAGNHHDLNAPGTVMAAIVSEGTDKASENAASHVDVLSNPQLQRLVGQILLDGLDRSELPELTINAEEEVEQGAVFSFGVQVGGPAPSGEEPVIIWETGDGRTLKSGLETTSHVYSRSGVQTLTCAVYYPSSGLGTIASKRITVTNAVPEITLVAEPENVRPGETVSLRVDRSDRAWGDRHTYQWTFDGQPDPTVPPSSFIVSRNHQLTGTYEVSVRVTDDDGAFADASTSYTVDANPVEGNPPPAPGDPPDLREGAAMEYAIVIISGHDAMNDETEVRLGGRLLTSTTSNILRDDGSLARTTTGPRAESMRIFRTPDDNGSIPEDARVRVKAAGERVTIAIRHVLPDHTINAFVLARRTTAGDVLRLDFRWDDLTGAADDAVPGWLTPAAHAGRRASTHAGDPAAVTLRRNRVTGTTEIAATDRTEEDPETQISASPLAIIDTTVDDDPTTTEFDESRTLEGAPVSVLAATTQATTGLPTGAVGFVATDTSGQTTVVDQEPLSATVIDSITEEQAADVRGAIREVFVQGTDLISIWIIEEDDLWALEQGSGASLWGGRPLSRSGYVYGKSDNDIELLLPVFKSPLRDGSSGPLFDLDPFDDNHAARFARVAHFATYMQGDWYFKPPVGVDANGIPMGVVPDLEDRDEYDEYRFIAAKWRYYLPPDITATMGGQAQSDGSRHYIEIDKAAIIGNPNLFEFPATPAEIIAASLTHVANDDSALKEHLHEVTFFPYRREHFICGVPSIERPPPFGADPMGDAGMGRGLLFLKWVLEGTFIPHQAAGGGEATGIPFNANLPQTDEELRSLVYNRLAGRAASFALEGFEWGLSQELALLSASAHLRVEQAGGEELRAAPVFADYVRAHDEAIMRKVGKSVIRAVLGRMVADSSSRQDVFGTSPAHFESEDNYRTFEDFIARIASQHPGIVGLQEKEVRAFLGAKLGDDPTYQQIRLSPGGVTGFVESGFTYLRQIVSDSQNGPRSVHVAALENMARDGFVPEFVRRDGNVRAIDHGLPAFTGDDLPGRRAWWGRSEGAEARYRFVPELIKRGYEDAASPAVDVVLDTPPGDPLLWTDVVVPAGKTSITLNRRMDGDEDPFFTIIRDVSTTLSETWTHSFFLAGEGMEDDSFSINNTATFESSFLDIEPYFDEDRYAAPSSDPRGTRWVYRTLAFTDSEKDLFVAADLQNGVHRSLALVAGLDAEEVLNKMAKDLDDRVEGGGTYEGWTEVDVSLMTRDQKAAVWHVGGSSPTTAVISTAERPFYPITTGLSVDPGDKRWLLALEVTLDQGIEYALRANGAPFRLNADEGNEVGYAGLILFRQAYFFEILPDAAGQVPGSQTLQLEGHYPGVAP